jgi:hypothetical protein
MTAMQPGRIPLYLMHGNVLRVAHPGQCYVEEDRDMVDCGLEFLQVLPSLAAERCMHSWCMMPACGSHKLISRTSPITADACLRTCVFHCG